MRLMLVIFDKKSAYAQNMVNFIIYSAFADYFGSTVSVNVLLI